jgi:hypothetical protein
VAEVMQQPAGAFRAEQRPNIHGVMVCALLLFLPLSAPAQDTTPEPVAHRIVCTLAAGRILRRMCAEFCTPCLGLNQYTPLPQAETGERPHECCS